MTERGRRRRPGSGPSPETPSAPAPGEPRPPEPLRWLEAWLARRLGPGVVGQSIVGDLREGLARYVERGGRWPALWYGRHALGVAWAYRGRSSVAVRGRGGGGTTGTTGWGRDFAVAGRSILRRPASSAAAVVTLALGIGMSTFMFSVVWGAFQRSPAESDRVMLVRTAVPEQPQLDAPIPLTDVNLLAEEARSFDAVTAYRITSGTLLLDEEPLRVSLTRMTAGVFEVVGVEPFLGRDFTEADHAQGAPAAVILGHDLWRTEFGGSRETLGRTVRLDGGPATVVGVMPPGFAFPSRQNVWMPLRPAVWSGDREDAPAVTAMVRVAEGVPLEEARAEVERLQARVNRAWPSERPTDHRLVTFVDATSPPQVAMIFGALLAATLAVLLVACANVANLLLARALARAREAGIRSALGAGRLRVALPFLAEAVIVAAVAVLVGSALAAWGVARFDVLSQGLGKPYWMTFELDLPALLFAVGAGVVAAGVAGSLPALRVAGRDAAAALRSGGRGEAGGGPGGLSRMLVTTQVALSCAIVVLAGLSGRSIARLSGAGLTYAAPDVLAGRVVLPEDRYADAAARLEWAEEARRRVADLPGVAAVAVGTSLPSIPAGLVTVSLEQTDAARPEDRTSVFPSGVSPNYFDALGTPLLAGRDFTPADGSDAQPVAIVNRSFARRILGTEDPMGRTFRHGSGEDAVWRTVVGLAPDLRMEGFVSTLPGAGFYLPLAQQDARGLYLAVRGAGGGEATALLGPVRSALAEVDGGLPLFGTQTMEALIAQNSWHFRLFGGLFVLFGLTALFIASVGLYGILSFAVARRTPEMGLRMALGAGRGRVVRLVLGQGMRRAVVGAVLGLAVAYLGSGGLALVLYEVDPRDPLAFGAAAGVVGVVAALASLLPALRATRVDPVRALNAE